METESVEGLKWFTSQAGIVSAVLLLTNGVTIWLWLNEKKAHKAERKSWSEQVGQTQKSFTEVVEKMASAWGVRFDQLRGDIKEAFGMVNKIADGHNESAISSIEALSALRESMNRVADRIDLLAKR